MPDSARLLFELFQPIVGRDLGAEESDLARCRAVIEAMKAEVKDEISGWVEEHKGAAAPQPKKKGGK